MAHRIFRDSRGIEWQTWDVLPRFEERRVRDRRIGTAAPPHSDLRARSERRVLQGHRSVLNTGMGEGWLCFETEDEKRRLTPIPGDWHGCDPQRLEEYCANAKPARRRSHGVPAIDLSE